MLLFAPASLVGAGEPPENAVSRRTDRQGSAGQACRRARVAPPASLSRGSFGGYTSEQDDPGFFMSPDGKTDPQAELDATLKQFFSDELVGRSRQPAQCAFIARYHWLREQLQFDETRLPPMACERFDRWFDDFEAQSITLIFPSAFLNNPASMFGHTLLRVDQKGQTEQTRILAYTINYAADVPPDAGMAYPIRGIFGGYSGYFSTYSLLFEGAGVSRHRESGYLGISPQFHGGPGQAVADARVGIRECLLRLFLLQRELLLSSPGASRLCRSHPASYRRVSFVDRSCRHSPADCIETRTGFRHRLSAFPQQRDPAEARIFAGRGTRTGASDHARSWRTHHHRLLSNWILRSRHFCSILRRITSGIASRQLIPRRLNGKSVTEPS